MAIKTILLSRLETDLKKTLDERANQVKLSSWRCRINGS